MKMAVCRYSCRYLYTQRTSNRGSYSDVPHHPFPSFPSSAMASRAQARTAPSSDIPPASIIFRALAARLLDLALAPVRISIAIASRFAGATAPPTFHILVLASLVPFIGLSSLGAGLVVRSWIPTGWKQVLYLQYGTGPESLAPFADLNLPTLATDTPYDINLELVMPHFAKNSELGACHRLLEMFAHLEI
jgi:hypothetical protein